MLENILKYWRIIELHGTHEGDSKQIVNQVRATNTFMAAMLAFLLSVFFIGFYDIRCFYVNILAVLSLVLVFFYNSSKTNNYLRFLLVSIICVWTVSTASIMTDHNSPDAKVVYTHLALLIPLSLSLFSFHEILKMIIVVSLIVTCFFSYETVSLLVTEQKEFTLGDSFLIKIIVSVSLCLIPLISIYNIYLQSVILLQDRLQEIERDRNNLSKALKESKATLKNLEQQARSTQDSLQETSLRCKTFGSILDSVRVVSFQAVIRNDGHVSLVYISNGCFSMFGYPSQDLLSLPLHLTLKVYAEDVASFQEMIRQATDTQTMYWRGRLRLRSGMYRWFEIQAACFPEVTDGPWLGSFTDIHEETLQREQDDLRIETDSLLVRYSDVLLVQENQDPILWGRKLFDELAKDFSILYGTLYLPSARNTHLQFLVGFGIDEKTPPPEYEIGNGTIGTVAKTRKITFWKIQDTHKFILNTATIVPQSVILIPLIFNSEIQGVLEIHTHYQIDENTFLKMERLSHNIAASLISLRTQLRVNELLIETQRFSETVLTQKETLSTSLAKLELAQTDLFLSKQRLEQQLNVITAQALYAEFDFGQRLIKYNRHFYQDLGYTEAEIKTKYFDNFEFRKIDSAGSDELEFWPRLLAGKKVEGKFTIKKKRTGEIWCVGSLYPLMDSLHQVNGVVLIATNKTDEHENELKLAEQKRLLDAQQQQIFVSKQHLIDLQKSLSEQETKLSNLINNTQDLIYAIDADYNLVATNRSFEQYYEKRMANPFTPNNSIWHYHPIEECDYWKEIYWNALNGTISRTNQRENINEQVVYFESVINPMRDQDEKITGAAIFRRNVTERKETELKLKRNESSLRRLKDNLESMVEERTKELQSTINDLTSVKSQLVLSEKMAALGQLIAGVAHEINTPIGAILGSSQVFQEVLPQIVSKIPAVYNYVDSQTLPLLQELLKKVVNEKNIISSKESRKIRKDYAELLLNAGFEENQSEEIADTLAGSGFVHDLTPYLSLFSEQIYRHTLELCRCFGQLKLNADNIQIATQKTRKTAQALKNYSHSSNTSEPKLVDLQENIDTILTLYQNQLKYDYQLEIALEPVPLIMGIADELGQVWTNIIQNAIHVMPKDGSGKLQISLFAKNDDLLVKITDNGGGIPPENIEKIFQKFFTTKDRGVGTGLGLDICKQIVENHGGSISVQSIPGNTCFSIILPKKTPYSNQSL